MQIEVTSAPEAHEQSTCIKPGGIPRNVGVDDVNFIIGYLDAHQQHWKASVIRRMAIELDLPICGR